MQLFEMPEEGRVKLRFQVKGNFLTKKDSHLENETHVNCAIRYQ